MGALFQTKHEFLKFFSWIWSKIQIKWQIQLMGHQTGAEVTINQAKHGLLKELFITKRQQKRLIQIFRVFIIILQ